MLKQVSENLGRSGCRPPSRLETPVCPVWETVLSWNVGQG